MKRREFITLLGGAAGGVAARGARAAGRAGAAHRRAHEHRRGRSGRPGPHRRVSGRRCSNWAGPTAATCGSTSAGARAMPTAFAPRGRNWSRLRRRHSRLRRHGRGPIAADDAHRADRVPRVADPVGAGFVESLARPGGNATGFTQFEYGIGGKWLELLKEIAPHVTRAAVLRDSSIPAGIGQFAVIQAAAPSLGVDVRPVNVRDAAEDRARHHGLRATPNGGLLVTRARCRSPSRADHHAGSPTPIARVLLRTAGLSTMAACSPTGPTRSTSTGAPPAMSIASSRARSRPTCRCRRRPSTSW